MTCLLKVRYAFEHFSEPCPKMNLKKKPKQIKYSSFYALNFLPTFIHWGKILGAFKRSLKFQVADSLDNLICYFGFFYCQDLFMDIHYGQVSFLKFWYGLQLFRNNILIILENLHFKMSYFPQHQTVYVTYDYQKCQIDFEINIIQNLEEFTISLVKYFDQLPFINRSELVTVLFYEIYRYHLSVQIRQDNAEDCCFKTPLSLFFPSFKFFNFFSFFVQKGTLTNFYLFIKMHTFIYTF